MSNSCYQKSSSEDMKKERTQSFVALQQAKQDEEGWQVLCQVALSLQRAKALQKSQTETEQTPALVLDGLCCIINRQCTARSETSEGQRTLALRTRSCLPPSPCMTPELARVSPILSAKSANRMDSSPAYRAVTGSCTDSTSAAMLLVACDALI